MPSSNQSTRSVILTVLAVLVFASTGLPSPAWGAGLWQTQTLYSDLVTPENQKAFVDLGRSRTAALGHLDSDGMIDLVVAYGDGDAAFAVVNLGDVRFRLGPHHDLERERKGLMPEKPFAREGVVYPLPFAPDWLAVGDWDADGDFDVVFAKAGLSRLYWMKGDGEAHPIDAGFIELNGKITAFEAGDLNRRDGLKDLAVAVDTPVGSSLLVFEGPDGAFSLTPEYIAMPASVTALAVDRLNEDGWVDVAAVSGSAVVVVSGRDRRLSWAPEKRRAVGPATTSTLDFNGRVLDIAAGDFVGRDRQSQLAVRLADGTVHLARLRDGGFAIEPLGFLPAEGRMLAARASGRPGDDLILSLPAEERVEIHHAGELKASGARLGAVQAPAVPAVAVIAGRLNIDTRDDLVLLGNEGSVSVAASKTTYFIEVNSTNDADDGTCDATHCSFREAINTANALDAGSTITFDLALGSVIRPSSYLPQLTQPDATVIDGTVGSGLWTGRLALQGDLAGIDATAFRVSGGNASISKLVIGGFDGVGIFLDSGGNNTITGCLIGFDETGAAAPLSTGINISGSPGNTIGGTTSLERNYIASSNSGIQITRTVSVNNLIVGNYIGVDQGGTSARANFEGIYGSGHVDGNQIGSTDPGGGNVISGNTRCGISITCNGEVGTVPWLIQNNLIGLTASGDAELKNITYGILITATSHPTIGGTTPAARNVIAGSDFVGIQIDDGVLYATVSGNYIGTDQTGSVAIGNGFGILVENAEVSTIGGSTSSAGNLISGNNDNGICSLNGSSPTELDILNNDIGLTAGGAPLGNDDFGLSFEGGHAIQVGNPDSPNHIAYNSGGVEVGGDTYATSIRANSIHDNGGGHLGIDLGTSGVTPNDDDDADTGPNNLQNFPVIYSVDPTSGEVSYSLESSASTNFAIHFYESPDCDPSGYGEGKTYLGETTIATLANGSNAGQVTFASLTSGAYLTATATDPGWNTSEFSQCFRVPALVDLSMTKTDSADPVTQGASFFYTLQVDNAGPDTATSLTVTDTLPAGVVFVSVSGTGWSCSESTGTVTCTRDELAAGSAPPITVSVTAPEGGTTLDNTASVSSADNDSNSSNDQDSESTVVEGCYVLTLEHTGNGADPVASPTGSAGCSSGSYLSGEVIQLTAAPDAGWEVGGWTGTDDDAGTALTNSLTMPESDHTVSVGYVSSCVASISPSSATFPIGGGSGSVTVTIPAGCQWTATSQDDWLAITSGASGTGDGVVEYSVADLAGGNTRNGAMTIAGQPFEVIQYGVDLIFADGFENSDTSAWSSK